MSTVFRGHDHIFDPLTEVYFRGNAFFIGNVHMVERVILGPNLSTVTGHSNQVFGNLHTVMGDLNLVAGTMNYVEANCAVVAGQDNRVTSDYSVAFGAHNFAPTDGSFVVGRYADANVANDVIFVMGAGESDDKRYNALTLTRNGTIIADKLITVKPIELSANSNGALILRGKEYGMDLAGDQLFVHTGNLLTLCSAGLAPDGNVVYGNAVYIDKLGRLGIGAMPSGSSNLQVLGDSVLTGGLSV